MTIRAFDALVSIIVLALASPVLAIVAVGIKVSSRGPLLYLADRVGKDHVPFRMYKFRSMHVGSGGPEITATNDDRVFAVGRIIRRCKLDELPQLVNVIKGDMAIVGPRPEAPGIVETHYEPWMHETLGVLPGVTSPGSIYYYAYGDELLDSDDPSQAYVDNLLVPKLALDLAYIGRASFWSNLATIFRTALSIGGKLVGAPIGPDSRDVAASAQWVEIEGI